MNKTTNNRETTRMMLSFYNLQAGTAFRLSSDKRVDRLAEAIERLGGVAEAKTFIKAYIEEHPVEARESFYNWMRASNKNSEKKVAEKSEPLPPVVPEEEVKEEVKEVREAVAPKKASGSIEEAIANIVDAHMDLKLEDAKAEIIELVKQETEKCERQFNTIVNGEPRKVDGVIHEAFDTVLKFVANDEPVYLVGPAGTGKNHLCKQVAQALDLDFYFTNAVTQEYKLTGFTDANGNYQPTQFYKAFTQGGLFMLDEMDASIPEVLVILNAAIANRYFDFPAPIGYVEAHPDFRIIAAGNTIGHGADYEYVGRTQQDMASLDRFAVVEIDYCVEIENSLAGDVELADFCREFRRAGKDAGIQVVVSYRAISRLAKMTQLLSLEEALKTCLVKGLEKDDLNVIIPKLSTTKYATALRHLARVA